jgi:hypothetical protein
MGDYLNPSLSYIPQKFFDVRRPDHPSFISRKRNMKKHGRIHVKP